MNMGWRKLQKYQTEYKDSKLEPLERYFWTSIIVCNIYEHREKLRNGRLNQSSKLEPLERHLWTSIIVCNFYEYRPDV